jgi:hypothetical protein
LECDWGGINKLAGWQAARIKWMGESEASFQAYARNLLRNTSDPTTS